MDKNKLYEKASGNIDYFFYRPTANFLIKEFKEIKNLLEIGCGTGNILKYIRNANSSANLTGIDVSQFLINLAEKNSLNKKINFTSGKIIPLPFTNNSFTEVFSVNLLYTLEDYKKLFYEIYRVLKTGGRAILIDWNKNSSPEDLGYITAKWGENFPPLLRFFAYRGLINDFKNKAFGINELENLMKDIKIFHWEIKSYGIFDKEVFWVLKLKKL